MDIINKLGRLWTVLLPALLLVAIFQYAHHINSIINSIGGIYLRESFNTLVSKAEVTIPGAPFRPQMTMKQMAPNKSSTKMEVNMNGQKMTLMKSSFDGETGYTEGQGQRKAMDQKQIDRAKAVKGIFEELYYSEDEIELMSINSIDFKDAYKVKITEGEKVSYRYYSVDSSLLLSEEEEDENNNITVTYYDDYRDVSGIKFPFNINTPSQKIELNFTEILINEEIKDSDF